MSSRRCIELLNLGISAKRSGDYKLALIYYNQAKEYDEFNLNIYYNTAKVLAGTGNYKNALRNFLTAAHLGIKNVYHSRPSHDLKYRTFALH